MPRKKTFDPNETLQTTIYYPVKLAAWLGYQAAMEGISRNELVVRLITDYHKKCTKAEPTTPPIA